MTKSLRTKALIAAGFLTAAPSLMAAVPQIECPAEISQTSIQVHTPGWKPYIQYPLYLASAGISAGPPESLAVLRGEPLNKKGQPESTRFVFGEMGFDQGKWLDCGYGIGSPITLSKRLNDNLKECVVTYLKPVRPDRQDIKILCK
jgi:hypothetical protein